MNATKFGRYSGKWGGIKGYSSGGATYDMNAKAPPLPDPPKAVIPDPPPPVKLPDPPPAQPAPDLGTPKSDPNAGATTSGQQASPEGQQGQPAKPEQPPPQRTDQ